MPFTEPYKPQDQIDHVRKVGRLAQIILDMRVEYERRPRPETLQQIVARISEMEAVRVEIIEHMPPAPDNVAHPAPEAGVEPAARSTLRRCAKRVRLPGV